MSSVFYLFTNVISSNNMTTITQWIITKVKLIIVLQILVFLLAGCNINPYSSVNEDKSAGFNGSFEIVKEGLPVNWNIYKPTVDTAQAKFFFDTFQPPQGKQSLKIVVSKCSSEGGWHSPGIFQEMPAETGKTYLVSYWIKNQGCKYMIRMDCFIAGTEDVNHPKKWITYSDTIPDWQRFEYEFTFSNDLNQLRFELNILSPGTFWIDDIRIEKKLL